MTIDLANTNDLPVAAHGPIELAHATNTLAFAFGAVSFLDESAIQYRYRLAGFEAGCSVVPAHVRTVRYTNLPPGRYAFELEAGNAIGVWSETVSSPAITILPSVWRRWWFFAAVFLGLTGLVFVASAVVWRWRYASRLRTEITQRTEQLRESESRYHQLFDSGANPKLLLTTDGVVVDANAAACELTGCDRAELLDSSALASGIAWIQSIWFRMARP